MKKGLAIIFVFCLTLSLAACGGNKQEITVISREEGSGTRGSFTQLTGIETDGVDRTYDRAEINSSTAVVLQSVSGNKNAIGYLSLAALHESVKALAIDGVPPSISTVQDGSYPLARPFLLGTLGAENSQTADFLAFLQSDEAGEIILGAGYVPMGGGSYESLQPAGVLRIAGSSSVAPVLEKLAEAYQRVNPNLQVQIQTTDSSTGLLSLSQGLCDVAMSSRPLTRSETDRGILAHTLCMDGIAVIVNRENSVDRLTLAQLRAVFTGDITDWTLIS
ncbi:MAG: substrate-binding domain-containing protein [Oscillospiraceae bacterium]|nr:substrate-binding domain-containing protein [Oscillospiraceae bacterium]